MLKPPPKFSGRQFYEEVIAELSPFHPDAKQPAPGAADPVRARLLAYAARARELDTILAKLGAKEFCAADCDKLPEGCCWEYAYRIGNEDFFEFLAVQDVEARKHGWHRPGSRCRYHSETGCKLSLFKAPVCIRLLCPRLVQALEKRFGRGARDFNDALAKLSLDIQRSPTLLGEMDHAIALGRKLLAQ